MTLKERCKQEGFTVTELAKYTGRSRSTLRTWFADDRDFFEIVLFGAAVVEKLWAKKPD